MASSVGAFSRTVRIDRDVSSPEERSGISTFHVKRGRSTGGAVPTRVRPIDVRKLWEGGIAERARSRFTWILQVAATAGEPRG